MSFSVNLEVQHELEYQVLLDNRKEKFEAVSLLNEDTEVLDTVSWESLESSAWDLMRKKGMNWKLFCVWLETFFYVHGWNQSVFGFEALKALLFERIQSLLEGEEKSGCVEFLDKILSTAIFLQPIKGDETLFQFLNYKKNSPQRLYDLLATLDRNWYENFLSIYDQSVKVLSSLSNAFSVSLSKTLNVFSTLEDVLTFYKSNFILPQEEEQKALEAEAEVELSSSAVTKDKQYVFASIAEALEVLQSIDHQHIAIPLLRKVMRWSEMNISEILHEVNSQDGAYHILNFLMD